MRATRTSACKAHATARGLIAAALVALAACASDGAPPCARASVSSALTPAERWSVGRASAYPAHETLSAGELYASVAARRALGWSVVERTVEEVELASAAGSVPRFMTWYDQDDIRRVVRFLRRRVSERGGAGLEGIDEQDLDDAFAFNEQSVRTLATWPEERLEAFVSAADTVERQRGLGGISRTLFDPLAARHLARSASRIASCEVPSPGASGEPEVQESRQLLFVDGCGSVEVLRTVLARNERLTVTLPPDSGATLTLNGEACGASCTASGPLNVDLQMSASGRGRVEVFLERHVSALAAPCLVNEFPAGSAVVKTSYLREGFGFELRGHDTDAASMAERRLGDEGWTEGRAADEGALAPFTVELANGQRYRLAGLHVMTKELPHWVWASAWWSDRPGGDFGADRPADLGDDWGGYKMCVVTDFVEGDLDLQGIDEPDLHAALAERAYDSTECSNPYIEEGAGNATTNCIGCHQHAGASLSTEAILAGEFDGAVVDAPARFVERQNFPTDYVFSASLVKALLDEPI
ncbi:MAG: hypothetical protein AAF411_15130 [Myxococcota bacterium]